MNLKFKKWVYVCLTLLSFITIKNSHAQCAELINNGSFETITTTPPYSSQPGYPSFIPYATGWDQHDVPNYNGTPDLFTTSSPSNPISPYNSVHIPCNYHGYQNAHTGNSYAGLLTVHNDNSFSGANCTEFITTNFTSTLTAGKIYEVSLWVSRADLANNAINGLGVWIGTSNINAQADAPTYNCPTTLSNNDAWTQITFPYCANGDETLIIIGGSSTTYGAALSVPSSTCSQNSISGAGAYVYIDDVSVKEIKFTVPAQTLCANSTGSFTAVPTCSTIVTSALTYTWNYGDGSATVTTNTLNSTTHSYSLTGTYTGSLSVSTGSCINTFTYTVHVPNVPITITTNSNTICNAITNFTAAPSPTGSYTYTWSVQDAATGTVVPTSNYTITAGNTNTPAINFANINQNVNVCVTITSTLGCQYKQCLFMPSCCATPTNVVKHSNKTFTVNTTVNSASVSFGGTITVNNNITLTLLQTNAQLDPNTKFVLNGNGKIRFINSYVHGCNYMWDGIYPIATGTVDIINSIVEDAKRVAIDSLGGATILFTNSYINKNNMGIALKANKTSTSVVTVKNVLFTCSNVSIPTGANKTPAVTPNLTNASTLGAFTTTVMLAPYNTQKTYCGIYFENASHTGKPNSAITIGINTNGNENVFDKIQHGSFVNSSKVHFQNNVFQNIKSTIAPSSLGSNAGVLVWGPISGVGGPYYTQVGGSSVSLKNTFTNNDLGVASVFPTGLIVTNNRFETQNTGVYVVWNSSNLTVQTSQNKFINNQVGISFNENTLVNATISENWFDNTSAQGTYADNFAIRTTEAVLATNPLSYPAYLIFNNYINGYYNGIYAALTFKANIRDNEIHMRADNTTAHYQNAIKIETTNDNEVYNNTSDYPSGSNGWWQFNIFTSGSTVPKIHCNNTNYGGVGILANGLNYTAAGNGFYGNAMSNHGYGFWLNANGEIGDQYYTNAGTNYSSDNTWTSCTNETYANANCNMIGAKFYTRSTTPYRINTPTNTTPGILLIGTNNSAGFTGACYGGISTPTLNLKVTGTSAQKLVMQNADDIANGSILFADHQTSLKQIARKQLLSNLNLSQINPSFSEDLTDFVNKSKHSSLGALFLVDSLINTADNANLKVASSINNNIVAENEVDLTQKQFNEEYISFIKNRGQVEKASIVAFENIANLCPTIYGQAVYQARTVLFNLNHKNYTSVCEEVTPDLSLRKSDNQMIDALSDIIVYPNPASTAIFVSSKKHTNVVLKLYDVMGNIIIEKVIIGNEKTDISKLSNGIYMYKLYENDTELKAGKLIVVH